MFRLTHMRRRGEPWTTPTFITSEHPRLNVMLEIARHMAPAWYGTRVKGPDGALYFQVSGDFARKEAA